MWTMLFECTGTQCVHVGEGVNFNKTKIGQLQYEGVKVKLVCFLDQSKEFVDFQERL
jgi:hypothetical protein